MSKKKSFFTRYNICNASDMIPTLILGLVLCLILCIGIPLARNNLVASRKNMQHEHQESLSYYLEKEGFDKGDVSFPEEGLGGLYYTFDEWNQYKCEIYYLASENPDTALELLNRCFLPDFAENTVKVLGNGLEYQSYVDSEDNWEQENVTDYKVTVSQTFPKSREAILVVYSWEGTDNEKTEIKHGYQESCKILNNIEKVLSKN